MYWFGFKHLNKIEEAYTTFEAFMRERISSREEELKASKSLGEDNGELIKDVFGRLVNARLSGGKLTLSDEEIIGNCFIFVSLIGLFPSHAERLIAFEDFCRTW